MKARPVSQQRSQDLGPADALMARDISKEAVQGSHAQALVRWNGDPVRKRLVCLKNDVTARLMDLAIGPASAEAFDQSITAEA